jgi:hypothetical protein
MFHKERKPPIILEAPFSPIYQVGTKAKTVKSAMAWRFPVRNARQSVLSCSKYWFIPPALAEPKAAMNGFNAAC